MYIMDETEQQEKDEKPVKVTKKPDKPALKGKDEAREVFIWPQPAVWLLIEAYNEKADEFEAGAKRNNTIWSEIATMLNAHGYVVNGLQCSMKFSGLKRTYKHIQEQAQKGAGCETSWPFYSAMDALIGQQTSIQIVVEGGATDPLALPAAAADTKPIVVKEVESASRKRRFDTLLENYLTHFEEERTLRREERQRREKAREAKAAARRKERQLMHKDNVEIQKSILAVLQSLANKK